MKKQAKTLFVKSGDLKKRQLLCLANLQPFLAIFCQLHKHLSQNLGADGHFEGLNVSKSQLNQFYDINYKCPWQVCFSILEEKKSKICVSKMAIFRPFVVIFWQLHRYLSQNWDSDGHFEAYSVSKI